MKNKKILPILLLIMLIGVAGAFIYMTQTANNQNTNKGQSSNNNANSASTPSEKSMYLDGFPQDQIPLYKLKKIDSFKYFVNDDPSNFNDYFGVKYNYYNVVFYTEATQTELLDYYKSILDQQNPDLFGDTTIEGKIGDYKISISHYGSDQTAYLQVYLPQNKFEKENPYYKDCPQLVEFDAMWLDRETSYGYLSQNNGQIECTQYFSLDVKKIKEYQSRYIALYKDKPNYTLSADGEELTWEDDGYKISLNLSSDHGRAYLMMRKAR